MEKLIKRISELFQGYEYGHGQYQLEGFDEKGKKKGKLYAQHRKAAAKEWRQHLEGEINLAICPLLDNNTCLWAVIDIDAPDPKDIDAEKINKKVQEQKLPLVMARSTSGCVHLYVFFKEPVDAQIVRNKLSDWAARIGNADAEVFPKQTYRMNKDDIGNSLAVPYHNVKEKNRKERFAYDENLKPLTIEEFLDLAENKKFDLKEDEKQLEDDSGQLFEGGPPCLKHIYNVENGFPEGTRNNGVFNMVVYLKKRFPDDWKNQVHEYNQAMCDPPLSYDEVNNIIKSNERKDYEYKCKDQPICDFCNNKACRKQKYGVGNTVGNGDEFDIYNITKYEGDPVIWMVDIAGQRLELSTDQLTSQAMFVRACVSKLNRMPRRITQAKWEEYIDEKLKSMTPSDIIYVPEDASKEGQFRLLLEEFLLSAPANTRDDIYNKKPYWGDDGMVYFQSIALLTYLRRNFFKYDSEHEVWQMLRKVDAENKPLKVKGVGVRCWSVPAPDKPEFAPKVVKEFPEEDDPNKIKKDDF